MIDWLREPQRSPSAEKAAVEQRLSNVERRMGLLEAEVRLIKRS